MHPRIPPKLTLKSILTFTLTLFPSLVKAAKTLPIPIPPTHSHTPSYLWATHYNGHLYSLVFNGTDLSLSNSTQTCGAMPSWLTFDSESRVLYCSDESGTEDPKTHGSLTAYHPTDDGGLDLVARTQTMGGGVNSVIYEDGKGGKYLAIAHYEGSALSTYKLPLEPSSQSLQSFHFNKTSLHKNQTAQQSSPHPHQVFLDPTGSFIVSPDLGADLLRVYSIDAQSGKLHDCPSVNVTYGSGPRHGVFWSDGTDSGSHGAGSNSTNSPVESGQFTHQRQVAAVGKTMMYLVNEIGGTMMVFDVSYARSGCLDFQKTQTLVPYPGGKMPEGATPSEVRLIGDRVYVSVRSDGAFDGDDSMVVLNRSGGDGSVVVEKQSSAFGKVPRTFAINRAGDLVAVGDQASATVVIVRRDRETGDLGEKVASLQVGEPGKVGTSQGLSSVVWEV